MSFVIHLSRRLSSIRRLLSMRVSRISPGCSSPEYREQEDGMIDERDMVVNAGLSEAV
jgi:hypothetical protein